MSTRLSNHSWRQAGAFGEEQRDRWISVGCWSVCMGLALVELLSGAYQMSPDGVSYLDMSEAVVRRQWHLLVNPLWSPLYPFLIGLARWLVRPTAFWEFPVAHLLNFFIFLGALASFEFLLRQVIRASRQVDERRDSPSALPLPTWIWQLVGYSLFAWSSIVLGSGLFAVTPDLLLAAFIYLSAGLVLQLRTGANRWRTSLALGLTLGLGYLAKSILFPIAFVFVVVAFLVAGGWRKAIAISASTLLVFAGIATPLCLGISKMVGRPSFSESGNLNYAWHVNGKNHFPFYSSSPPHLLKHPINRIYADPNVFEFGQPFQVTYPLWFDPWYWNAGIKARVNVREQLRAIGRNLIVLNAYLVAPVWGLIGGFLVLLFMSPSLPRRFEDIVKSWPLLVCGAVAPCLYALVHVEPRYIAPFVLLVWLALFSGVRVQKSQESIKLATVATLVIAISMLALDARCTVPSLVYSSASLQGHGGTYYQAVESMNREGLRPGEAVAVIGPAVEMTFCARLARLRIVAQTSPDDASGFWEADPHVKAKVFEAMAETGARAVITEGKPPCGGSPDWQRLGNTNYYLHFLNRFKG